MKYLPLLLTSCIGADYVEVSPYAGQGYIDFDRPMSQADTGEWGMMVTVGWDIGERAHIERKILYNTPPPAPPTVVVNQEEAEPPVIVENETTIENIIPETKEQGLAVLLGALGLLFIAIAAAVWQKTGHRLPFIDSKE